MALVSRDGIRIDQTSLTDLSAGSAAAKFATTDAPAKTDGDVAIWMSGNVTDSTIPLSSLSGGSGGGAITVNGAATVLVNGVGVSFDDTTLVNGA